MQTHVRDVMYSLQITLLRIELHILNLLPYWEKDSLNTKNVEDIT